MKGCVEKLPKLSVVSNVGWTSMWSSIDGVIVGCGIIKLWFWLHLVWTRYNKRIWVSP
jgi:hypothetical protein